MQPRPHSFYKNNQWKHLKQHPNHMADLFRDKLVWFQQIVALGSIAYLFPK